MWLRAKYWGADRERQEFVLNLARVAKLNLKEIFDIVRSKAAEGWRGVEKAVEKIMRNRESQKT